MKYVLTLLVLLLQNCNTQIKTTMEDKINYKEKFKNLYKEVEKNPEPPIYIYEYNYSNTYVEMYINDKLFLKSYSFVRGAQDFHLINQYLNNNLKQKLKVVLKPIDDELFNDQSYFKITLSSFDKKSYYDEDIWSNKLKKIENYTSDEFARDSNGDFSVDANGNTMGYIKEKRLEGKPYFEKEFEFEAKLPFKLPKLQETSKDLRRLDSSVLKKQVLAYFERFRSSILKKSDENFFWKTMYNKSRLNFISNYRTEEEIEFEFKNNNFIYNKKHISIDNINKYQIVFYDQGRIVTLENTSPNNDRKGKSVLNFKILDEKGIVKQQSDKMQFYFHIPKGSNSLEVIY